MPLRTYQARAVAQLVLRLQPAGARACLLAPPGAGKTICALHIAAEVGQPLVVIVPTTALLLQWRQRIDAVFVAVSEEAGPPPITVITYAAKTPFPEHALIILDEAHHVTAAWGGAILERMSPDNRVLGLTGTPPYGARGWDRFIELVSDDPVAISTPPLVREGHLCPYQDLVWPVLVDLDELPQLQAVDVALSEAESILIARLGAWVTARLREDLWTLTEARFTQQEGLLVALCRRQTRLGRTLPVDLPPDPELIAPLTLQDRALLLWHFGMHHKPSMPIVRAALEEAGYRVGRHGPLQRKDHALASLASASTRVRGSLDVLAMEHQSRGDGLRALLLTDRDVEGDRLSARQVLRALVRDRRTDMLDPILVTGSVFWVDDDLYARIASRLPGLPWESKGDHHEIQTTGWKSAERVALATTLLTEGLTQCLVGTRHLLGEGWDCPAVNCVIDLTGISTSVTVNQIRGRALRIDPADPSKVASLWEVLAMAPGVSGGDRMLAKLQERHASTLGIDARGRIRTGAARIDPIFACGSAVVAADLEATQSRMIARLNDRSAAAARWAVGGTYRDERVWRVEGRALPPPRLTNHKHLGTPVLPGRQSVVLRRRRANRWGGAAGIGVAVALTIAALPLAIAHPLLPIAGITLALAAGAGSGGLVAALLRRRVQRQAAIFDALHAAMLRHAPGLGPLEGDGTRWWVEGPESARFASAAAELLGPLRYPRYLLIEPSGDAWPVPGALGASRDLANDFSASWAEHVGPCEVIFARQGKGRELLRAAWRVGMAREVEVVEDWE